MRRQRRQWIFRAIGLRGKVTSMHVLALNKVDKKRLNFIHTRNRRAMVFKNKY